MQTGVAVRRRKQSDQLYFQSLPYDGARLDCGHSPLYIVQAIQNGPWICGLCLFKEGFEGELPTRIHQFKTLADNGNPQQAGKFQAHVFLTMGLVLPRVDSDGRPEPLHEYRRRRGQLHCDRSCRQPCLEHQPREREHYTEPAWKLFPVASALWKLMGYQPPLGIVLVRGVNGRTEAEIAKELDTSHQNVVIRMAKAVRTAVGYLPRGTDEHSTEPAAAAS